jgi:arsenate reductase
MTVTIYHNPSCLTSRNVLSMILQSGEKPIVIEYLKNPPSRERLNELIKAMDIPVRALLREQEAPHAELRLANPKWSDDHLLDFMLQHPILINRPIVVTPKGLSCADRQQQYAISCQTRHRADLFPGVTAPPPNASTAAAATSSIGRCLHHQDRRCWRDKPGPEEPD